MAVGLTSQQGIGLIIAGVFVVAFIGAMAYIAQGRRPSRDRPDIPPAMQPGPSDADLEKLYVFAKLLWRVLPVGRDPDPLPQ